MAAAFASDEAWIYCCRQLVGRHGGFRRRLPSELEHEGSQRRGCIEASRQVVRERNLRRIAALQRQAMTKKRG